MVNSDNFRSLDVDRVDFHLFRDVRIKSGPLTGVTGAVVGQQGDRLLLDIAELSPGLQIRIHSSQLTLLS